MKGKVKTLTEETYEMKGENDTIVPKLQGKAVFEFTKDGELKKKTTSYDDYENIIAYSRFERGRAMRIDKEIITPAYIDKDSSRFFVIDNYNERLVTWGNYNHEYARIDTTLIRYSGDMIKITPLSNIRKLTITETRDGRGNLIRETRSLRGKPASWCEWVFDEDGLLINEIGTRPGGYGVMEDYGLFYEYGNFDKQGNWLLKKIKRREIEYDENSEISTTGIVVRQIKYY